MRSYQLLLSERSHDPERLAPGGQIKLRVDRGTFVAKSCHGPEAVDANTSTAQADRSAGGSLVERARLTSATDIAGHPCQHDIVEMAPTATAPQAYSSDMPRSKSRFSTRTGVRDKNQCRWVDDRRR